MSWSRIWAVTTLTARLLRRSWRFWILAVLALLASAAIPTYYSLLRWFSSGLAGSAAILHPSIVPFMTHLGVTVLMGLAAVWLAFDAPYRHRKSRSEEVVHAAPMTNADLVLGLFLGTLLPVLVVAIVSTLIALGIQAAFRAGVPVEAHAVHLFLQTGPALAAVIALTLCVAVISRSKVLAGIVGSAVVAASLAVVFGWLPMKWELQQVLDLTGLWSLYFHSEMVGYTTMGGFLLQRFYLVLVMVVLLALAVWRYPRLRARAGFTAAPVAAASAAVVAVVLAVYWIQAWGAVREASSIAAAEQEELARGAATRVTHYDLELDLTGGSRLAGTARMQLRNETGAPRSRWVFLLNSGLEVESVEGASHERGLTTLVLETPPVAPGEEHEVTVVYGGRLSEKGLFPGGRFELRDLETQVRGNLSLFVGAVPFILDEYAYLPPMARFYPVPDVDHGWEYPDRRPVNWATGRLRLKLPEGWVAATQGRPAEATGEVTEEWAVETPVPVFSVYAGPYQTWETEVGGIRARLHAHPGHAGTVEFFAEARDEILERAEKQLAEAEAKTGLDYPYAYLQLVELPLQARAYTDGLDSFAAFHTPGVVGLREAGLFTANLDRALKGLMDDESYVQVRVSVDGQPVDVEGGGEEERAEPEPESGEEAGTDQGGDGEEGEPAAGGEEAPEAQDEEAEDEARPVREKDVGRAKADLLERFYRYDFLGGSVPHAVVPSMWDYVVQPDGRLYPLLQRGLGNFVSERATGQRRNFSIFAMADFQQVIPKVFQGAFLRGMDIDEAVVAAGIDEDRAYELMTTTPIDEVDPFEDPKAYIDVVTLRGQAFFEALEQELGPSAFADALALLREERAYSTYTLGDLEEAVEKVQGEPMDWLFASWLEGTDLPGFRLLEVEAYRIASREAQARYQVLARVENAEPVAGYVTLELKREGAEEPVAETLRLEGGQAVEWGLVVEGKPQWFRMSPILAHNRNPARRQLGDLDWDPKEPGEGEPFEGTRATEFVPWPTGVVVDDADEGFRIEGEKKGFSLRFRRARTEEGERPIYVPWQGLPNEWSTWNTLVAYGRYNPSAVAGPSGEGEAVAVWKADLPEAGEYEVMVWHPGPTFERAVPRPRRDTVKPGSEYVYRIATADGVEEVSFDPTRAEQGWSSLGTFYFGAGPAEVRLPNDVGEGLVWADAVRFLKVDRKVGRR